MLIKNPKILELNAHADSVLCGVFTQGGGSLATGSKDTYVNMYDVSNSKLIGRMDMHRASICCLSVINSGEILASGGDYKCGSIILWDAKTLIVRHRLEGHSAAVTAIVDLEDGENLASASYDKKINVFNYRGHDSKGVNFNPKLQMTVINKTGISCLILNGNKTKLIASGLDKTILVWKIERNRDLSFRELSSNRVI